MIKTTVPVKNMGLIHKAINVSENPKAKMIYILALYTGGRSSEVLSLRWCDILDKDEIVIRTTKQDRKTKKGSWKKKTYRIVPVPDIIKTLINDLYRGEPKDSYIWHRRAGKNKENLYKPVCLSTYSNTVRKDFEKVGIKQRAYGGTIFRKTFARYIYDKLCDEGVHAALLIVQKILNHRDPGTTAKYIGIDAEEVSKGYSMLDFFNKNTVSKFKRYTKREPA